MRVTGLLLSLVLWILAKGAAVAAETCDYTGGPATVALPGHPFAATPTADGCWLFVWLGRVAEGDFTGVAVLRNVGGRFEVMRKVALPTSAGGMALTHDGKLLVVAADNSAAVYDVDRLTSGDGDPLVGRVPDEPNAGAIYVAITPDDRLLFVSDERAKRITVVDLRRARANDFGESAIVGRIPVGSAPVGLAMARDGRRLYATSQIAPSALGLPARCNTGIAGDARLFSEGVLSVIDVARAGADPAHAVIASVPSGCMPVRIVLAPSGQRAWVTARSQDALLDFDLTVIEAARETPPYRLVPVGQAPVGVAIRPDGAEVWSPTPTGSRQGPPAPCAG